MFYIEIYCSLHLNIYCSEANNVNVFLFPKIYLIKKFYELKSYIEYVRLLYFIYENFTNTYVCIYNRVV